MEGCIIDESESIPIVLDDQFVTRSISSYIRGYHAYMDIWTPRVGDDTLICQHEENNVYDLHAVSIVHNDLVNNRIVGHVPLNYAPIFHRFLKLPNHRIRCRVTGERINRGGGYGLEIPADYIFLGDAKAIRWISGRISSIDKDLDKTYNKCWK